MHSRHAGQSAVEREKQVETLLGANLTYHDARRAHPQRLFDEVAELDLAGAFQPRLTRLHSDPVGVLEA